MGLLTIGWLYLTCLFAIYDLLRSFTLVYFVVRRLFLLCRAAPWLVSLDAHSFLFFVSGLRNRSATAA